MVAAAAVAALGVGVAVFWLLRPPQIQDAAHDWLDALASGDVHTLTAMTNDSRVPPDTRRLALDAFAGASDRIADPVVQRISDDGSVHATARLGTASVDVHFTLTRAGHGYQVGDFLGTLTVDPTLGAAVRVGDATVPAHTAVAVLPAQYPVRALPDAVLDGAQTVAVTDAQPVTVTLPVTLGTRGQAVLQTQLETYEDRCAASTDHVPAACGLRVPWAADLRTLDALAFRIDTRPTLHLDPEHGRFAATGGVITATARGTGFDGRAASHTYRTEDWALRGEIVFSGATVQLAVR